MRTHEALTHQMIYSAAGRALIMFDPRSQFRNPVLFILYLYMILLGFFLFMHTPFSWFYLAVFVCLFLTIFFANFAQALAESSSKAQASVLRQKQVETSARLLNNGIETLIPSRDLKRGDLVVCEVGDVIPADGEVIEGLATVDESAITGESAPVIRESGGDLSSVTTGSRVVSDRIVIRITADPGNSFLERMISLIEYAKKQKSPNQIALRLFLSALSLLSIITVATLIVFTWFSHDNQLPQYLTVPSAIALLAILLPTTISSLLSTISISGMDRLVSHNVIAKSSYALEAAGDIDTLILDKTGTITLGNRMASSFLPIAGHSERECAEIAQLASLSDETPEGRSIVALAKNRYGLQPMDLHAHRYTFTAFTPQTRMSGVDLLDENGAILHSYRKGAADAIENYVRKLGGDVPLQLNEAIQSIAKKGGTPLLITADKEIVGILYLKDLLKGGIRRRFARLRKMGIRTMMVTNDNPLTASAIAAEAGLDDFIAEATPEMKLQLIRDEQQRGRRVAMTGDGTSDAPALAQAEIGVAMNTGALASREAGNFVDLDNNPTKLIEIIEISKQLLITRGALSTFSMMSGLVEFLIILPAVFAGVHIIQKESIYDALNFLHLNNPESAILSTLIFNTLVIPPMIWVSLKGIRYGAQPSDILLRRNMTRYLLGGVLIPLIGIKLIDTSLWVFYR